MEVTQWLSLFSICLLGAMSPGPSLAVVVNAAVHGGRGPGLSAAVSHGVGVGLYGLLTVAGLAILITRSPALFLALQLAGAGYLIYLGLRALRSSHSNSTAITKAAANPKRGAAISGFLVAFLNPKLAIFMLALFSQFLRPEADVIEKGIMALTVGVTDAAWYCLVAALVSQPKFLEKLQRSASTIDRVFGVILILLAASVAFRALA